MKNLFVPYEIALLAKKNGFNEGCLTCFFNQNIQRLFGSDYVNEDFEDDDSRVTAPIYQQLIDWFRIEHDILIWVETAEGMKTNNYYKALNDAIKKAFKMIPQISE